MGNQIALTLRYQHHQQQQQQQQQQHFQGNQEYIFEDYSKNEPNKYSFKYFIRMVILRNRRGGSEKVPVKKVNNSSALCFLSNVIHNEILFS